MLLSPYMTIALLIVIWLAMAFLAFFVARKERAKRDKRWYYIAMIVLLVIAAVLLALDQWVYDII